MNNKTIFTVTTEELCEILKTSKDGLKGLLKRDTLDKTMHRKGYHIVDKYKIGRYNAYDVIKLDKTEWEELQDIYKIEEEYKDEHTQYSEVRLNQPSTKKGKILKLANMPKDTSSRNRANKYDRILEAEKGIVRNDYEYAMYNKESDSYSRITAQEYKTFWYDNAWNRDLKKAYKNRLDKHEISQGEYDNAIVNIENSVIQHGGKIAIKVVSYSAFVENSRLLKMILEHRNRKDSGECVI